MTPTILCFYLNHHSSSLPQMGKILRGGWHPNSIASKINQTSSNHKSHFLLSFPLYLQFLPPFHVFAFLLQVLLRRAKHYLHSFFPPFFHFKIIPVDIFLAWLGWYQCDLATSTWELLLYIDFISWKIWKQASKWGLPLCEKTRKMSGFLAFPLTELDTVNRRGE